MFLFNTILIGLREITSHWFRSILTILGVVLGIMSLVTMSAIVQGMENAMKEQMATFGGADKINIDKEDPPSYQDHKKDFSPGITVKDAYALKEGSTLLKCISPEMLKSAETIFWRQWTRFAACIGGPHLASLSRENFELVPRGLSVVVLERNLLLSQREGRRNRSTTAPR